MDKYEQLKLRCDIERLNLKLLTDIVSFTLLVTDLMIATIILDHYKLIDYSIIVVILYVVAVVISEYHPRAVLMLSAMIFSLLAVVGCTIIVTN